MKKRWFCLGLVFCLAIGAGIFRNVPVSQEQEKSEQKETEESFCLGISIDQEFESRSGVVHAIEQEAEKYGFRILKADAEGNSEIQNRQIETLLEEGIDVLLVCAVDQDRIGDTLKKVKSQGKKIIAFDRNLPKSEEIDAYVGPDSVEDGATCAEEMIKALENQKEVRVLELVGALNDQNGIDRSKGWHSVVDKIPEIEVIQAPTDWNIEAAAEASKSVLLDNQKVDAVFCAMDSFMPEIIAVLRENGKMISVGEEGHIFVNGINGSKEAYEAVSRKECDGMLVMNLEETGKKAVELADSLCKGNEVEKNNLISGTYFTWQNIRENKDKIWGAE